MWPALSVQGTGGKTGGPSCEIQRSARRAEFMGNRLQVAAATSVFVCGSHCYLGAGLGSLARLDMAGLWS